MKMRNLTIGAALLFAVIATPLASADIVVGACTDAQNRECKERTQGTDAVSCDIVESPFNGSVIDRPTCNANF